MRHVLDGIERSASFSRDRRYRYALGRRWGEGPAVTWVMLNPSTADHRQDDPTIRRCIRFSRAWGFDALTVVNLFALRSLEPRALIEADDPVGGQGDRVLRNALRDAAADGGAVVAAWGNLPPRLAQRAFEVERWLPEGASCLGVTVQGQPRHPLYVPAEATLSVFRAPPTMAA